MADDKYVVAVPRQLSACGVGDGNIVKNDTGFEGEVGNDCVVLMLYEGGKRVLRLRFGSLYGI